VVDNRSWYDPFSCWRFYVVYVSDLICSFMWDRAEQLGESGEYRTGRLRVVYFHIRSFEGGSHRLCRLKTTSVEPCCNKHWVVYCRIWDLWGPINLVALTIVELDDTPPYFTDDIGIVFGPPTDYPSRFSCGRWHYGTVGPAQLFDSHRERWSLVCLRGSRVSCCQVDTLQGDYWFESPRHPQIWVRLVRCVQT
jgi:hypothetical protein